MDTREWYATLHKPSWAPKPEVFGRVWSVIYPIIFIVNISIIVMLMQGTISWRIALPYWMNLAFNFSFTPVQFGLRNQFLSMIIILLVLVTVAWSMVTIYPYSLIITLAYVPYLLWVSIASIIQINLWWLNR